MRLVPFLLLFIARTASAETYWTLPDLLRSFFSSSEHVTYKRVTLDDPTAHKIEQQIGHALTQRDYVIYYGTTGDHTDGYAITDKELGEHEPIDFAVLFDAQGIVQRVEITAYREAYGDEVRSARFRRQFEGKRASDHIAAGRDIDIVSGASISSRSLADGVKRDTLIVSEALRLLPERHAALGGAR
jgi:electron transport complex protein RnfG